MEWHWLYKDEKDLPKANSKVLTIKWNEQTMSGESRIRYEVDNYVLEQVGNKVIPMFANDKDYNKTVAWCYIDEPKDVWQFLKENNNE